MASQTFIQSERVRASRQSAEQRLSGRSLRVELEIGIAFILAAVALAGLSHVDARGSLAVAAFYVLAVAVLSQVRFDIGAGFAVPTQAVFVPMLFALPVAVVPLLVAAALALGMLPAVLRGRVPASRLLTVPSNSWFALGPAVVLLLANDGSPDGRWGILLLAMGAQFVCDLAANAARERMLGGITLPELFEEMRQIYLIDLALAPLGLLVASYAAVSGPWSVLLIAPLFAILRWFSQERQVRMGQMIELNDAYRGTALVLGDVVEADDSYTGEHCKGVVALALQVGGALGLDAVELRKVEFGALLHDVGKIAVPKEIVNKPGTLDDHEWAIIRTHTIEGQKMLQRVGGFMSEVGEIVRSSHERWDGGGYPDGLAGEEIPLEARIVSCCDAYNAMTTTRSYRTAMTVAVALNELHRNAGTQFDRRVVRALIGVIGNAEADESATQSAAPAARRSDLGPLERREARHDPETAAVSGAVMFHAAETLRVSQLWLPPNRC